MTKHGRVSIRGPYFLLLVLKRFNRVSGVKGGGEENQDLVELAKFAWSLDLTLLPGGDASTIRSWVFSSNAGFDLCTAFKSLTP